MQISRGSIKVKLEIVEEEDSASLDEIVENLQKAVCLCTLVYVCPLLWILVVRISSRSRGRLHDLLALGCIYQVMQF